MPHKNAASFNQILTEVLQSEKAPAINQFCQSFTATFNADTQAAKMIGTGKLEMCSSKKEDISQLIASGALDIVSVFGVPTGTLGNVTQKALSALFKGIRKKGYQKVTDLDAQMTHVELLSQGLVFGLLVHYKDTLLDSEALKNPEKCGKKTAKSLLKDLKTDHKDLPSFAHEDSLNMRLNTLLSWCVKRDQVRMVLPNPGQAEPSFNEDDYSTLLLFASAEILGLPRDHFVSAQQQKDTLIKLENQIQDIIEETTKFESRFQTMIDDAIANNSRPEDIIVAVEKGATLNGKFTMNINCLIDRVKSNMTDNDAKHRNFMAVLKQRHQENLELMDKQHEHSANRNRKITGIQKGGELKENAELNMNIDSVERTFDYTDSPTTSTSPLPVKNEQPIEESHDVNLQSQPSTGTPSLGE